MVRKLQQLSGTIEYKKSWSRTVQRRYQDKHLNTDISFSSVVEAIQLCGHDAREALHFRCNGTPSDRPAVGSVALARRQRVVGGLSLPCAVTVSRVKCCLSHKPKDGTTVHKHVIYVLDIAMFCSAQCVDVGNMIAAVVVVWVGGGTGYKMLLEKCILL